MTLVDLGVMGGCDARTQGASIAWLLARPRTRQRARTARPGDPDFILVRALRARLRDPTRKPGLVGTQPLELDAIDREHTDIARRSYTRCSCAVG